MLNILKYIIMFTWLDKSRLKAKCKEVNAAHRTKLWHSVLMCVLEAVNPITSCISYLTPIEAWRRKWAEEKFSLQTKSSSQVEFGPYPSPVLPFHLHHWNRNAETLNNTSHPNPRGKLTQVRSEATQQDWWKTSASPQSSPLPVEAVQWNKASLFFHAFMTCDRWSFMMKGLWA